ncbi:hypothetical protein C479_12229 [Halovivax asiaticus JCM 14624]|uniref:DUF7344 domain-containing protein n=1 Tax=Halovivax asiaticus JCM 14624 TaxID=1227490 RepID=M0BEI6_9EURY|nr:hypothetical protein [Halovivax asiaticus]ELZ08892.1 hypothetical protein C479_12229 [Halovivax asiaticus JCM 14624]
MEALQNGRRRRVLAAIQEEGPLSVADATRSVAADSDCGEGRTASVRVMLHHAHLPKLEAMDYICWNREDETVSEGPAWDEIAPFVQQGDGIVSEPPADLLRE